MMTSAQPVETPFNVTNNSSSGNFSDADYPTRPTTYMRICIFLGRYYAASEEDAFLLALATDPVNELLITGDSNGFIAVWDISSYCISRAEYIIAQVIFTHPMYPCLS